MAMDIHHQLKETEHKRAEGELCPTCIHRHPSLVSGQLLFFCIQQALVYPHLNCKDYKERK